MYYKKCYNKKIIRFVYPKQSLNQIISSQIVIHPYNTIKLISFIYKINIEIEDKTWFVMKEFWNQICIFKIPMRVTTK